MQSHPLHRLIMWQHVNANDGVLCYKHKYTTYMPAVQVSCILCWHDHKCVQFYFPVLSHSRIKFLLIYSKYFTIPLHSQLHSIQTYILRLCVGLGQAGQLQAAQEAALSLLTAICTCFTHLQYEQGQPTANISNKLGKTVQSVCQNEGFKTRKAERSSYSVPQNYACSMY